MVLAIDVKLENGEWKVYINGGQTATPLLALDWAKEGERRGAGEILLTSMDHDGTKNGFAIDIVRQVSEAVNIPVIASRCRNDGAFCRSFLKTKASAALAAGIFHYGEISIPELKAYLQHNILK